MSPPSIVKIGLMAATSGLALLATGAAQAQTSLPVVPPEHFTLDARGVDLVSGQFIYSAADVVIGQGAGQLARVRGLSTYGTGTWLDTTQGQIVINGTTLSVVVGQQSEIFTQSGSVFTPQSNNGATLTRSGDIFTYTSANGTVARYSLALSFTGSGLPSTTAAVLYEVVAANGDTTNYHYLLQTYIRSYTPGPEPEPVMGTASRLQSVTNNHGNQLYFGYESASIATGGGTVGQRLTRWLNNTAVTGLNNAVDYCAPLATGCTFSRTWPRVEYSRTPASGLETVTDQSGRVTTYQTFGNATTITLPGSSAPDVTVNYSATNLASVTDASGTWIYGFADSGATRTTTVSGPLGQSLTVVSNLSIGRATTVTNALGQTTSYIYDAQRRVQRVTNPEGDYTELTYDGRGNVTQTTLVPKSGSGLSNIVTSAAYSSSPCANPVTCNFPNSTTDARGYQTDYVWNATHGGLESITSPAPSGATPIGSGTRPQTRIAYAAQTAYYKNSSGVIVAAPTSITLPTATSTCATGSAPSCVGTSDEIKATVVYGVAGVANNLVPTSTTSGDGTGALAATTTMTWTPNGDVLTVDGPLSGAGDTTLYRYDNARQVVGVIGPDPDGGGALLNRAVRMTYNPRGQVTLTEQGTTPGYTDPNWASFTTLQRRAVTYDSYGRPLTVASQNAAGNTLQLVQTNYDASGRSDCTSVRMNPAAFSGLPGATAACSLTAPSFYGPDRITKMGYDLAGRPVSMIRGYASGSPVTESVTYTANGLPQSLTDAAGNVSIIVYDGFDRSGRLRYPNATGGGTSTTDYQEYGYDAASNITAYRTRANQTFTATYDNLNRSTARTAPVGTDSVAYTYDNLGRPLTAATSGQTITQVWDPLSRLTSQTGPLGTMAYQYDLAGRRIRQTWPDAFYVTNTWDLGNQMTAILQGGSTQIIGYGYDNQGRRTGITRGNGVSSSYAYDGISRLASLSHDLIGSADDVTFSYDYNPAGQITVRRMSNPAYGPSLTASSTTYQNNGLNQVTNVGGTSVSHDANGNVTNDATRAFTYDAANRAVSANGGTSTLSYDPLGRLYDVVGGNGGKYLYDGVETVGFATTGTTLANRFVRGPGVDEIVANFMTAGSTPTQYWAADERGSLVNLTAGSGGATTVINTYDEYGVPSSGNLGRLQYTGQLWLPDFGAYHYKARAYQPALGRFLQTDPIGYAAGGNLYAYVGADPVNWTDPLGLDPCGGNNEPACPLPPIGPVTPREIVTGGINPGMFGSGGPGAGSGGFYDGPATEVDEIVVTAQRNRSLGGQPINFRLRYPREQLWVGVYGQPIIYVPTVADMYRDTCGNELGRNRPDGSVNLPPNSALDFLIHTHPSWAAGWPAAGDYTSAQFFDVYGITPSGTWVLRQGSERGSAPTVLSGRTPARPSSGGGSTCK